jgi:predicted transcriptional regulator
MYNFVGRVKMENLSEDELKILLAVARSDNGECDAESLIRTLNLSEARAQHYFCRLSFGKNFLFWVGSPGEPDRYILTDRGRQFLLEGSYI